MKKFLSLFLCIAFSLTSIIPPSYAQAVLHLSIPGTMVQVSPAYVPTLLRGMTIHPEDPFRFDFIVDNGNSKLVEAPLKDESRRLVNYFLAAMTVPQNDLWVNLSPVEHDRIVPDALGKTELGQDLLAEDYILKQLSSSLMYPESDLGKKFWSRIYQQVEEKFGTSDIPTDTFNKVWILPEHATVYEHGATVYVVDAKLKVMLDSDYQAAAVGTQVDMPTQELAKDIIREVILPEIEKEVNTGENFAKLRQVYYSLILAKWYKEKVKNSILSSKYIDQNKTKGVDLVDPSVKEDIYNRYMEAYKKGVYNYIKEEYDAVTQENISRKYFSGGFRDAAMSFDRTDKKEDVARAVVGKSFKLAIDIEPQGDALLGPYISNAFSWLNRTFFRSTLKNVEAPALLAFKTKKEWTRRDFLQALGVLGAGSLVFALGCTKESDELELPKVPTTPEGIKIAVNSNLRSLSTYQNSSYMIEKDPRYQEIVAIGANATPDLIAFAQNEDEDTNSRKWAFRLLGTVGNYNDVAVFLMTVFFDMHYAAWWHQYEARRGFVLLVARQPAIVLADVENLPKILVMLVEAAKYDVDVVEQVRGVQALGKVGDGSVIPVLEVLRDSDPAPDVRAAATTAIADIKKRLGLKSGNIDNAEVRQNDAAMMPVLPKFNWLNRTFYKTQLKQDQGTPLVFRKGITSGRMFLRALGLVAAMTLMAAVGCQKEELTEEEIIEQRIQEEVEGYLRQLTMADPDAVKASAAYAHILQMGESSLAGLRSFVEDGRENTYARKWAIKLLGEVEFTYNIVINKATFNFLIQVYISSDNKYSAEHKKEAWHALKMIFQGLSYPIIEVNSLFDSKTDVISADAIIVLLREMSSIDNLIDLAGLFRELSDVINSSALQVGSQVKERIDSELNIMLKEQLRQLTMADSEEARKSLPYKYAQSFETYDRNAATRLKSFVQDVNENANARKWALKIMSQIYFEKESAFYFFISVLDDSRGLYSEDIKAEAKIDLKNILTHDLCLEVFGGQPSLIVAESIIAALSELWDFKTLIDASKITSGLLREKLIAASGEDALLKCIRVLTGSDPGVVVNSRPYNAIAGYGPEATTVLMNFAKNSKEHTDARKWALRLLGSVADPNDQAVIDYLNSVIQDKTGLYAGWHKIEAQNGLDILKSRQSTAAVTNAAGIMGKSFDAAMAPLFSNLSWLSGIFSKASLKNVKASVPLAFAPQRTWTRRDFLRSLGTAGALTLVFALGCEKDELEETLLESLQQLTMTDPREATSSAAYKNILKMGPGIWADLKIFASDGSNQTDARKWALRLIGEVAALDNQEAVDYLNSVINDTTNLYAWWHKDEAKNGLDIFYARKRKSATVAMGVVGGSIGAAAAPSGLGGIDMNDIEVSRNGVGSDIQFDAALMDRVLNMEIEGFAPVVVSLTPVDSVLLLLK